MDHDPRSPAYIATQGPLPSTVADFWQMVWENGCVVIVMLTPLTENGVKQSYHYWPDEGSNLYHIYEVNLVSEHIWCEDFLVRSFYLKNMQTNETRTVTQFHFLTWLNQNVPESSRILLDFRRYIGWRAGSLCGTRQVSVGLVSGALDGAGRTGTYILIDMVLNKMAKGPWVLSQWVSGAGARALSSRALPRPRGLSLSRLGKREAQDGAWVFISVIKGAKEIDIAATLEHLRDQRPGMVQTK
ncbi:hypothetical protein JZ751_000037, partial [Albula glossodonta]